MVLSEREQQALDEIERGISSDDPRLAAALRRSRVSRQAWWTRLVHDMVIVFSAMLAILCVVLGQVGAGFVAGLFAAVVVVVRRRRFPARAGSPRRRPSWLRRLS
ncbi:DUF3040 domain-containing protein [Pseudonocardia acaciae]|uniref:DUF3040 domain-containing protein n=1 Tax=Pseudonocardia acaciae TaxID=551276 RepID=UPI000A03794B